MPLRRLGRLAQVPAAPDRAEQTDGNTEHKDQPPVDDGEQAADDEAEDRTDDAGHLVESHRQAALVFRESVCQNGRAVGKEEAGADALDQPINDKLKRGRVAGAGRDGQQNASRGENREAEIVQPDGAEQIGKAPERDEEGRGNNQIAEQQPEEIVGLVRRERIDANALENGRHGDHHNVCINERHEDAESRIGQGDPAITRPRRLGRVGVRGAALAGLSSFNIVLLAFCPAPSATRHV